MRPTLGSHSLPALKAFLQGEQFLRRSAWDSAVTSYQRAIALDSGFTLASPDPTIHQFWVEHCIACRHIGAAFGAALGTPCVTNIWIPDGMKDTPADRLAPRRGDLPHRIDRDRAEKAVEKSG